MIVKRIYTCVCTHIQDDEYKVTGKRAVCLRIGRVDI